MSKSMFAAVLVTAAFLVPALMPQANAQVIVRRPYYPAYAYPGNGIYNGYYPTPYAGNYYAPRVGYVGPRYYGGVRYGAVRYGRVWR